LTLKIQKNGARRIKMDENKQVSPKAVPEKLSVVRNIIRVIFGKKLACSYCGRVYVKCHSKEINLFMPVPQNGKCCPDGHEGYVDEFLGWGVIRKFFDYVKAQDLKSIIVQNVPRE
jgi:hypothetical protein